jgi:integrase
MMLILEYLNTPTTQMEWYMAFFHAATALRGEEGFGLKWRDFDWEKLVINLNRAWSKGQETDGKNQGAFVPVPMHPVFASVMLEWRQESPYSGDDDWVFPSLTERGRIPRSASAAAQDYLRPAAVYAGVIEEGSSKRFGFHNLRHSLAEFLAENVENPAIAMKILRHRKLSTTTQIYTHRVSNKQREAQGMYLDAIRAKSSSQSPGGRFRKAASSPSRIANAPSSKHVPVRSRRDNVLRFPKKSNLKK